MKKIDIEPRKKVWIFFVIVNIVILCAIFIALSKDKNIWSFILFKALIDILIFAVFGDFRKIAFGVSGVKVEK